MNAADIAESMPDIPPEYDALLRIAGGEADVHTIRSESLVAMLSGLQQLAFLLARIETGEPLGERFKPGRAMRKQFALRCGVPLAGSYALPLAMGDVDELPVGKLPILDQLQAIWAALAAQDHSTLARQLPEPFKARALREFQRFLPKDQGSTRLYLHTRAAPEARPLTWRSARFIDTLLVADSTEDAVMTVTGELQRIDFATRQVTILYPPTRREIVCTYLPEIEDDLLDARKEPIQVTGRFVLDEEGNPSRLMDVSRIEPLDLSPLTIADLETSGLALRTPLEYIPTLDEDSQQYLCIEDPTLGLNVFALNREHLLAEIQEQLIMLWREYGCAPDDDLDTEARALKVCLHAALEESNAEAKG
ncbi:hypothetical protein [uncultured Thiocystis sp.]|jgi:hypothetical protein|uniref:hypothetical protein n=1 Tax=uncultured Thiocystis sp. TaxID=1202134 RepID=UPI0025E29D02|nr:hypothetical protein [uncultured Thiocystis sp.]